MAARKRRTTTCTSCGETGPHRGHGYCFTCYARWVYHGRPADGPPLPYSAPRKPRTEAKQRTPVDYEARFWAKVEKTDGCWLWKRPSSRDGYGRYAVAGRVVGVHRFAYEICVGPIPDGLVIDHVCHNEDPNCAGGPDCPHRKCVNPAHLAAVTPGENALSGKSLWAVNARKTHCPKGHPYTTENTVIREIGGTSHRFCRACEKARNSGPSVPKPHCSKGHPYSEENTYRNPDGHRRCRTCRRDERRRRHTKARTAIATTPLDTARS